MCDNQQHILSPKCFLDWKFLSVEKFKQDFGLLLIQERINDMSWSVVIYHTSEVTLEQVKYIRLKFVNSYKSLCTSNEWNIPGQGWVNYFWNCG